ncbi:YihY/virulence factor BrkB family protein [Sunxiuqinia sp. sy24]|uniref:YihY/virulence factor BrkB family protein n=1 Tax=Sunxiuqinia sp. sy24 TaxID=3461495 RepID=UPI0040453EDB
MKQIVLKKLKSTWEIFRNAFVHFIANNPVNQAATTAYFAIFSMAPILIIIISVFGYFTGDETMRAKLFEELNVLIGAESTQFLENAIQNYQITENSGIGAIIGILFFLISATTLFSVMQNSINYIWRVKVRSSLKQGALKLAKDRIFSFGVILSLGFVVLVSLIIDASISFLKEFLRTYFSPDFVFLAQFANIVLSLAVITAVFALIYRFLPDVKVKWSAAWHGAIFTAFLFVIGKFIIGLIIGSSNMGAVYGAASSFVIILLWIYFVSLIFYFGVELTHQYSRYYKHDNRPVNYAIPFEINPVER